MGVTGIKGLKVMKVQRVHGSQSHRILVSYGPGQRHHLDGQEFREQRQKDGFLAVPHLLSTALYAAP